MAAILLRCISLYIGEIKAAAGPDGKKKKTNLLSTHISTQSYVSFEVHSDDTRDSTLLSSIT
jgi:hypothetical protein